MRHAAAFSAFLLLSGNAFASGGIWCETEAAPAKINVHGGVSRGMGGQLFSFEGKVAIAEQAVREDLRELEFKQEHVTQYWFDGKSVNLVLYRERDADKPFGYVEVSIETKLRDGEEGAYAGSYGLTVFDGTDESAEPQRIEISGAISCFSD